MNEIKLKGRIASLHTDGNPDLAEILLTPQELIQQLPLSDMTLYGYSLAELAKIIDFAKSRGFDPKESEPKQETKFNPQSMDAKDWAKEFMRIYKYNQVKNVEFIDEDFMLGWFANAIMAGFDEADRRKPKQEKIELPDGYYADPNDRTFDAKRQIVNIMQTIDKILIYLKQKDAIGKLREEGR